MTWFTLFASCLLLIGVWRVGCKDRRGFVFSLLGDSMWAGVSAQRGMWDLFVVCLVFIFAAGMNYRKWRE